MVLFYVIATFYFLTLESCLVSQVSAQVVIVKVTSSFITICQCPGNPEVSFPSSLDVVVDLIRCAKFGL
ncbi:hypothetical protein MTR67_039723 [Solanum verrucosum]|uniref:Secreted protein n=1 Tax=Solanum verrucosum TaxID=315347 RepID=A0AAF0ZQQ0_SOLVR|nr:hypothetical protein MTR67_039723 [Solanum verrucosum]